MSYSTAFSQAIVTMVFVGDKIQQGQYEFVPTSKICESLNLKAPTLSKIINQLIKSGLVESKEGKNGGIRLKLKSNEISMLSIFEAIEADKSLFQIHLNLSVSGPKPDKAKKELLRILGNADAALRESLEGEYLSDFINKIGQTYK